MGDISDYYRTHNLDIHLNPPIRHSEPFTWWKQNNGKRIRLINMTTTHLQNTINLINNKSNWRKYWLIPLQKELQSRIQENNECDATEIDLY